ncbi:hypothetical protein EV580_1305 [Mycobacterium sp. BK086]|uniref:hypothetical protein n=1 Tax=Mycobacterium sp. BK086 TaxID=2512165 RepID=UPI0010600708|nr:hypothetical protein [Mycobacterium sp. BK086]TDO18123.1 hypothetical protein EV580_1305 [Mycobacterium sp. BK086]
MTDSSAEDVTVTVGIKRWVISDEDKMWALYKELKAAGWFGGVMCFENADGDKMQMTKGSQQLLVEVGNIVVSVNGVLASLSQADYETRYGPLPS